MLKKLSIIILLISTLFMASCVSVPLANGELWACSGNGYFDVLETTLTSKVRFTCLNPDFDVVFTITDNQSLMNTIRGNSINYNYGIVIKDGILIQIFSNDQTIFTYRIQQIWP